MKQSAIEVEHFGQMPDGRKTSLYTLKNANGIIVK